MVPNGQSWKKYVDAIKVRNGMQIIHYAVINCFAQCPKAIFLNGHKCSAIISPTIYIYLVDPFFVGHGYDGDI